MRRFRYRVGYGWRHWRALLLAPLMRGLLRRWAQGSAGGIAILDFGRRRHVEPRFVPDTVAALRLIEAVDPRRFRRIRREIDIILNREGLSAGSYNRPWRTCEIDYGRIGHPDQHPEWYRWWYAGLLVHEATHGALYSRRIPYTGALRARIERLCCTEQRRFAARADTEGRRWSEVLAPPFDERRWHRSWNLTRWQRTKGQVAQLWNSFRDPP